MFVLRAAGSTLLVYALFNAAFGLNRQELPWLISAVLLTIGGVALLAAQPWSRIVVLSSAAAAAAVGAISQFRTAQDVDISLSRPPWPGPSGPPCGWRPPTSAPNICRTKASSSRSCSAPNLN